MGSDKGHRAANRDQDRPLGLKCRGAFAQEDLMQPLQDEELSNHSTSEGSRDSILLLDQQFNLARTALRDATFTFDERRVPGRHRRFSLSQRVLGT